MSEQGPWWKSASVFGALGAAAAAVAADGVLWRLKGTAPDFALFVGRFHPLVVHLPIGIFILAGALEAMSLLPSLRKRLDPATPIILFAILISGVTAFVVGHLLAKAGGFPAQSLLMHRRLTLAAIVGGALALVAWTYHARAGAGVSRVLYRGALGLSLSLLSLGAHFGGNMTHGETYLTKYAPGPLRPLLNPEEPKKNEGGGDDEKPKASTEPLLYADVVAPILKKQCVECHGTETAKGSLRVDDIEHILKAGDSGPAVVPGSGATSLLVKRMHLPKSDDERMPPEGRDGPTPEEIAVVSFWIDRGANDTLRVRDALAPEAARKVLEEIAQNGAAPVVSSSPATSAAPATSGQADAPASSSDPVGQANSPPGTDTTPPPSTPAVVTPVTAGGLAWDERVQPILAARCESCHGASKQKGKLRVDTRDAIFAGGAAGPAVVPGNPEASSLVSRAMLPLDHKDHMPPKKEAQLSDAELATLVAWVKKGAGPELKTAALGVKVVKTTPPPASTGTGDASTPPASTGSPVSTGAAPTASPSGSAPPASSSAPPAGTGAPPDVAALDTSPADAKLLATMPAKVELYAAAVKPILNDKCGTCHSGDGASASFRVDDDAKLISGGISGVAVIPGDADKSLLLTRMVVPTSDSDHMPPEDMTQPTPGEIEIIRRWIAGGAKADTAIETSGLNQGTAVALASFVGKKDAPGGPEDRDDLIEDSNTLPPDPMRGQTGGCASCTIGGVVASPAAALVLFAMSAGALVVRRRRRADRKSPTAPRA